VVIAAGEKHGLALCGMTAAFSLRMEKGYIMRFDFAGGHTPYELGLGWTVKPDKGDFRGRGALLRRKTAGFQDRLMALVVGDAYLPASGDAICRGDQPVGQITSAAFGYTLGRPIALGYLPLPLAEVDTAVFVQGKDGQRHAATVGRRPLYDPAGKRLHG
jgi:dimethylglycine oxidase